MSRGVRRQPGRRAGASISIFILFLLLASGCAGPTVYQNGIRHCYLCGVRVARVNGYEVREQDFHPNSGELVAARSMPELHETEIKRSWWRRTREVFKNLWEHGKFEAWDADIASERVRTEERMTVTFSARATGPLGWLGVTRKDKTKVKIGADHTEYGREDWVISRTALDPATHERLKQQLRDCLGLARATEYTRAVATGVPTASTGSGVPAGAPTVVAADPANSATTRVAATPVAVAPAPFAPAAIAAAPPPSSTAGADTAAPVVAPAGSGTTSTGALAAVPAPAPVVRLTKMSADRIAELLKRGKDAYEGGKYQEAIPFLEQTTAADAESAEALVYLAASYYQEKRLDDAIATYETYLKLAPDDLRSKSFLEELRREKAGGS